MEDSGIIELFFERSEQAVAELSARYGEVCRRTAMNILGDTAEWGDYDARITRYNGEMKAWNYENQGNAYAAQAKQYTTVS